MIAVVLAHLLLVVWAWPWFDRQDKIWLLALIGLFAPILSWPLLAPLGVIGWSEHVVDRRERRLELELQRREEAVRFLRDQLVNGTPVEQANAREILAMWSVPEAEPPREEAPILLYTDRPQDVRREGDWLVVGGLPRAHVDPPTLESYYRGCRCPACVHVHDEVVLARGEHECQNVGGFALAIASAEGRVRASLGIPPSLPLPVPPVTLGPEDDCPDCEWETVVQRNGIGQVVATHHIPLHRCPWHTI